MKDATFPRVMAVTRDVTNVLLEAGNSPLMIFKHDRELVRPKDAEVRFGIVSAGSAEERIGELREKAAFGCGMQNAESKATGLYAN